MHKYFLNKIAFIFGAALVLTTSSTQAQTGFPLNGVQDQKSNIYAFTNANIIISANESIELGTLLIQDNKIIAVGKGISIPTSAISINVNGGFIYPSFIEPLSTYGVSQLNAKGGRGNVFTTTKPGAYYWNEAVKPEQNANTIFNLDATAAEKLLKAGFGTVNTTVADGIVRGTSTVVTLNTDYSHKAILKNEAATHYSFGKGVSTQDFPSSLMGSISLLRQYFIDVAWYGANAGKVEQSISLDYATKQNKLPAIFEVNDVYDILRVDLIGKEFNQKFIIKDNGEAYQRLADIKAINATLISTVNFPKAPAITSGFAAQDIPFTQLKHWELAPYNLGYLEKEKINFILSSADLENVSDFIPNVRKAIKNGLSQKMALTALTTMPASALGIADKVGSIKVGLLANFIICSDSIFAEGNKIYQNWVQGQPHYIQDLPSNINGDYSIKGIDNKNIKLSITGKAGNEIAKFLLNDTTKIDGKLSRTLNSLKISADGKLTSTKGTIYFEFLLENNTIKNGYLFSNTNTPTVLSISEIDGIADSAATDKKDKITPDTIGSIIYPMQAFGYTTVPTAKPTLIKNTTVWTGEKEGILLNTDVLIENGKISKIGKNLSASNAQSIDGTNKYLTAGIIDEHSHIAIRSGVNEGTQAVTAEVRIGDVVNPEDINVYRQLSGGVTASQLLHGSANPIGGQSALIKLRWGSSPEGMKIAGADGYIKCALGENVKQSNWGENNRMRFPQTRMGVEQVFVDAFTRATEYQKNMAAFAKNPKIGIAPRRDLELETLTEILNKKRFITCHSYVQSEINMLMHVADSFGFNINTFTHILEGYKVADKMKKHGVAASTFADWWGYKAEVMEAIPYNAFLMQQQGVITGINSDDAEMGRRLNQEAAKSLKYGGMSREEAWKMCTLNPAIMLHLDNKMGSIKTGKDADMVLWNADPLSIYAKVLTTWVDGIPYYDIATDNQNRQYITAERARIIAKIQKSGTSSGGSATPENNEDELWECETLGEFVK